MQTINTNWSKLVHLFSISQMNQILIAGINAHVFWLSQLKSSKTRKDFPPVFLQSDSLNLGIEFNSNPDYFFQFFVFIFFIRILHLEMNAYENIQTESMVKTVGHLVPFEFQLDIKWLFSFQIFRTIMSTYFGCLHSMELPMF